MYNCIFTGFCVNGNECDKSCPDYVESSYLLERNNISINSKVFHSDAALIQKYFNIISENEGKLITLISSNTNELAELITYCGICKYWKHSRLKMVVYNLRFSQYIDKIQKSWNNKSDSEDDYVDIWLQKAKLVIVSNIDYVNFKEFQCTTLLKLIQNRQADGLSTIIISPHTNSLVGDGNFFFQMKKILVNSIVK